MKSAYHNAWISALIYGTIATAIAVFTVQAAYAEQLSPPKTSNNVAAGNRAAARSMASVMAKSRAISSAQTPAAQEISKSHANANAAEIETTPQMNQQQTTGATKP